MSAIVLLFDSGSYGVIEMVSAKQSNIGFDHQLADARKQRIGRFQQRHAALNDIQQQNTNKMMEWWTNHLKWSKNWQTGLRFANL